MANLQQTMLLQQRLFLQALCQNSQIASPLATNVAERPASKDENEKKHFTAPSLSQYRFVSGQQVRIILYLKIYIATYHETLSLPIFSKLMCLFYIEAWAVLPTAPLNLIYSYLIRPTIIRLNRNQVRSEWNGR